MDKRCGLGLGSVPNRGIASETCGRVSATRLRNTVSERRIVTPAIKHMVNTPTDVDIVYQLSNFRIDRNFNIVMCRSLSANVMDDDNVDMISTPVNTYRLTYLSGV